MGETQYPMPNSLQNGRCSLIFTTLLSHTTTPTINPSSSSVNVQDSILLLLVQKIIFTTPNNTLFFYYSAIFQLPIFAYNHHNNLHQKCFLYLSHLANWGCAMEPGSQGVLWDLTLFNISRLPQSMDSDSRVSKSMITYRPGSENWCTAGSIVIHY